MDDGEQLKIYVELWKQTIDVQKHFNDIEIRIRGLALTVLTFALGAAAIAVKDGTEIHVLSVDVELASLILFLSAVLWLIFYFVDQIWYHRLLIGAVKHGEDLEAKIAQCVPLGGESNAVGLTKQISISSPYKLFGCIDLHSAGKIKIFYFAIDALLILFGIFALSADKHSADQSKPQKSTSSPTVPATSTRPVAPPSPQPTR